MAAENNKLYKVAGDYTSHPHLRGLLPSGALIAHPMKLQDYKYKHKGLTWSRRSTSSEAEGGARLDDARPTVGARSSIAT